MEKEEETHQPVPLEEIYDMGQSWRDKPLLQNLFMLYAAGQCRLSGL
jgi:hypothetical protein